MYSSDRSDISTEEINCVVEKIKDMVAYTQHKMYNKYNLIVIEKEAQDIVHDAIEEALKTFKSNREQNKISKSFLSWVWFKINKWSIPEFIRKGNYKYHGVETFRAVREEFLTDKEKLAIQRKGYEIKDNIYEVIFEIMKKKLKDVKHKIFFDTLLEVASETEGKQYVKIAADRLKIPILEAQKRMRFITKTLRKNKNLYNFLTQAQLKTFKI